MVFEAQKDFKTNDVILYLIAEKCPQSLSTGSTGVIPKDR